MADHFIGQVWVFDPARDGAKRIAQADQADADGKPELAARLRTQGQRWLAMAKENA